MKKTLCFRTGMLLGILLSLLCRNQVAAQVQATDNHLYLNLSIFPLSEIYEMNSVNWGFQEMQDGDIYPANSVFSVDLSCGNAYFATVEYTGSIQTQFRISNLLAPVPGTYYTCYTITSPEGITSTANIYITVIESNIQDPVCPQVEPCSNNNLWCYGDFQNFIPNEFGVQVQIGLQVCNYTRPKAVLDLCNGNIFLRIVANDEVIIPLSAPIKPDCTLKIRMRMAGDQRSFSILASSAPPCEAFNSSGEPNSFDLNCSNPGLFHCFGVENINTGSMPEVNFFTSCEDPSVVEYLGNTCETYDIAFSEYITTSMYEPCWKTVEFNFKNESNVDWNYIAITNENSDFIFDQPNPIFIDDLELTTNCNCPDVIESIPSSTQTVADQAVEGNGTTNDACEVPWEIVCYEQDNYFCVVNPQGASYYMTWNEPAFPSDPNGHCQDLSVMTPGQPIQFTIYSFDSNGNKCLYVVNTTWQCGQSGGGGDDPECACPNPIDDVDKGGKRSAFAIHSDNFEMSLVPNPANDLTQLNVVCQQEIIGSISIYDIAGKLISKERVNLPAGKSTQLISLGQLGSGNYSVELTDSFGIRLGLEKLIVVRE
jgi:hypothetical protein